MLHCRQGVADVTVRRPDRDVFIQIHQNVFSSKPDGVDVILQTNILPLLNQMERCSQLLVFWKRNMSKSLRHCQKVVVATCKSGATRQKQYPPDYCFLNLNLWFENFAPPPATIKKDRGGMSLHTMGWMLLHSWIGIERKGSETFNTCSHKILGCIKKQTKQFLNSEAAILKSLTLLLYEIWIIYQTFQSENYVELVSKRSKNRSVFYINICMHLPLM